MEDLTMSYFIYLTFSNSSCEGSRGEFSGFLLEILISFESMLYYIQSTSYIHAYVRIPNSVMGNKRS